MGALPGAKTWQQYKSGFGPWIDGMFSQSNFGVVTKMGFWLMPEPEAYLTGHGARVPSATICISSVDILNYLENSGVTNGMPDLGSPLLGIVSIEEYAKLMDDPPQPPHDPELAASARQSRGRRSRAGWRHTARARAWRTGRSS